MLPNIALLSCLIFILYLFKFDYKKKSDVSYALYIPLIWMMIVGSRMISLWLNPRGGMLSPEAYLEGSPLDRLIFILLIVAGLFILSKRKIYWSQVFKSNAWIFLLFIFGGISILWSDFPIVSFKRWIKATGNPIMVLIVLTEPNPVEAVKALIRRSAYVLVPLSIVFIKYFPELGRMYHRYTDEAMFIGVARGKNGLGLICLVSGLYFFWNLLAIWRNKNVSVNKKEVFISILFLCMISWLLLKANSATSLFSLIIGVCILLGMRLPFIKKNVRNFGLNIVMALLLCLPFLLFSFDSLISSAVQLTGHDATFWGRVLLWQELIDLAEASPLIGAGYDSFWLGSRMAKLWAKYWWLPTEAHNGYVETFLELGWIGVLLMIGLIVSAHRSISRTLIINFNYGSFRMASLAIVLIYNVTESAFKGLHLIWFVFLLIAFEVPRMSDAGSFSRGIDSLQDA